MRRIPIFARLLLLVMTAMFLAGCSRDPNVRKQKYLESGERYFAKAQYSAAAIQFGNALQEDPRYAEAHYQLARTYTQLQDWANAYQELERTVELQPQNYPARIDLAKLLIEGGELKQAQEQVDQLSAQKSDDPQVHILIATLHEAQEDVTGAIQELQKALTLDPKQEGAYLGLALLQVKSNEPDAAEASLKKAIELAPKAVNAQLALGNYYQSRQRFGEAEQQFRSAVEGDRQDPKPRIALAQLYLAEGKKATAEDFLKESKKDFADNSVGYRLLGDFYFAIGDFDSATEEYGALNRDHPKDLQVTNNYVQLLIIKNRLDEARKLNDAVLKTKPNDVDALIDRGQIQTADGHPGDGVQTLQTVIKNEPHNSLAYYRLGLAFDRLGSAAQAENAWQDAVRYRPDLVEAQRALALAALRKGDMAGLEKYSTQVVNLQPVSADGYFLRSLSYIRRGELSQAEPDARKAIEVAPSSPIGYIQTGNLALARRNYREAERAYRQALERDGRSSEALAGLINTYLAQNQADNALTAVRAQIAKVPDSSSFYDLLGTALLDHRQKHQDLESAEVSLEKAIQLEKHNTDAWFKFSKVQAARGSTDEAIATCQHALESNPGEAAFYVFMGQLYESKQVLDKAKEAYLRALEINPQHPLASNNLAYVMVQTGGNPDIAMPLAETARRAMPDSPQAADTMGWVFYHKGAYKSAIDQFQEALKLADKGKLPDDPTVHFHLGLAYEKIGQPALARQQLQRVLKINPNYSSADDVKKHLLQLPG
jgi:cellulose synthase operon protein C